MGNKEHSMNLALPLDQMTTTEKLRTMEALWDNLCENSDELISPPWHSDVLTERDNRVAEGKETVYDWNEAKNRIRKSI
jgi:Putative addiction module component